MTLSTKFKLGLVIGLILSLGLVLHQCNKPKIINNQTSQLKPNEQERILVNETKHTITVISNKGTTTTEYGRNPVISEDKQGHLTIQRNSWGFEHTPYVGFGIHESTRVELGASLFYYNKFDLNLGVSLTTKSSIPKDQWVKVTTSVSYNVYSNTNLFIGIDSSKNLCGGMFLRF